MGGLAPRVSPLPPLPPRAGRYEGPACPYCRTALDPRGLVTGPQTCLGCRRGFEAVRFDPPAPDLSVPRLAEAGPQGAHVCANHAGNVALTHCSRCGLFMCSLCRIDADGLTLCPACFERLSDEGALRSALATYRDYGRVAVALAVLGLLLPLLALVSAPGCVYYGVRRLKQIKAMGEPGGRAGMYVVFVLAALQLLGMVALVYVMANA